MTPTAPAWASRSVSESGEPAKTKARRVLPLAVATPHDRASASTAATIATPASRHTLTLTPATIGASTTEAGQFPDALVLAAQVPQANAQAERFGECDSYPDRLRVGVPHGVLHAARVHIGEVRVGRRRFPFGRDAVLARERHHIVVLQRRARV